MRVPTETDITAMGTQSYRRPPAELVTVAVNPLWASPASSREAEACGAFTVPASLYNGCRTPQHECGWEESPRMPNLGSNFPVNGEVFNWQERETSRDPLKWPIHRLRPFWIAQHCPPPPRLSVAPTSVLLMSPASCSQKVGVLAAEQRLVEGV